MPLPTPPAERDPLPDLLRGLAIGGILLVNMQDFAGYREWAQVGPDRAAQALIDFFVNGKSISLFALLFGAGLAAFQARHGSALALRRLAVLFVLGSLHFMLLWHGDIIEGYAVTGLALLLLIRLPPWLLALLAGLLQLGWLWWQSLAGLGSLGESGLRWTSYDAYPPGTTYLQALGQRALDWWPDLLRNTPFSLPLLLALLLAGAALQRGGVLSRPHQHRPLLWSLLGAGFLVGLPLNLWLVLLNTRGTEEAGYFALVARLGGGAAFALAYLGAAGLLVAAGRGRHLAPLVAAGRLSLTHYLTQSLLCTLLFYPYGLGQFGRWGALACLAFALGLYTIQVILSGPWLARFGRGPLEWLLRRVVYAGR